MSHGTLWLIGMMGSGKSTIGALVAGRLGRELVDMDEEVAAAAGEAAAELVARDEPEFRESERRLIVDLAGRPVVVATGGGVVLDERNVSVMRRHGVVVWLEAPTAVLAERVGAGEGRPLLEGDPSRALERILDERLARYRAAAHAVVDATVPPGAVATSVVEAWEDS